MSGPILLITAGAWVLAQVFGGNALGRLGIAGSPSKVTQPKSGTQGGSGQTGSGSSGSGSGGGGGASW